VYTQTSGFVSRGRAENMTAIQGSFLAAMPVVEPVAPPHLKAVVGRVVVSLATAVVVPAVLFSATVVLANVTTAVIVACAWMTGAMGWRWATRRRVSGLLLLTFGLMTVKTGVMLVTGNTFVYFVQPVFVDATVATVFLGSLWSARPVVARLAPDFYPMDAVLAARPGVRGLFRRLTLLWGVVIVIKGCVTLWLLESLSTVNFVLIKSGAIITLTLVAAAATIVWSVIVGRREGVFRASRRLR
jgi:uncharacterized membrane protein